MSPDPNLIRSERDRRVDEILSGASRSSTPERYHDDPSPPSSRSSFSANNEQGDSMKLKTNLASFGDSMKHKLGGLFGSTKPSSSTRDLPSPTPQLQTQPQIQQHQQERATINTSPSTSAGRVFGRPVINENHRPYSRNIVDQNEHESPNPFLMASSGNNVSPFARLNDRRTPTNHNIFDNI